MSLPEPYFEEDGITIYHGDCREVLPHLPKVDLVFTSPPYAAQREYGLGSFSWDALVPAALTLAPLSAQILVNLGLVHRDGEVVEYWQSLVREMRSAGFRMFGWYVWDQGDGLPGDWNGRFAPSHEWIFHFNQSARQANKWVRTNGRPASGTGLRRADGSTSGISSPEKCGQPFKIPDSVVRVYREMRRDVPHPAVFPVALPTHIIRSWSSPGESILDPFMGSGTTLVAAKQLGRRAIGIEIEEKYCRIAVERIRGTTPPLPMEPEPQHPQPARLWE